MVHPTYGIDVVALTFAVVLAAAIVLLVSHLMPELAELVPPPFAELALTGPPDAVAARAGAPTAKRLQEQISKPRRGDTGGVE